MASGGRFERKIAVQFSKWWSNGKDEDIFWRSHGSGARATVRSRRGARTRGQHSDITYTHPSGKALIKAMVIETKKGYNRHSLLNLIDVNPNSAKEKWEEWISKAIISKKASKSYGWCIIYERPRRSAIIVMPGYLWELLLIFGAFDNGKGIDNLFRLKITPRFKAKLPNKHLFLIGMRLSDFFAQTKREHIEEFVRLMKKKRTT